MHKIPHKGHALEATQAAGIELTMPHCRRRAMSPARGAPAPEQKHANRLNFLSPVGYRCKDISILR